MAKSIHSAQSKTFRKVLRQARRHAGLTQHDAAKRMGKTQTSLSKCERGERRIDVIELREFCAAFGVSLRQFAGMLDRQRSRSDTQF